MPVGNESGLDLDKLPDDFAVTFDGHQCLSAMSPVWTLAETLYDLWLDQWRHQCLSAMSPVWTILDGPQTVADLAETSPMPVGNESGLDGPQTVEDLAETLCHQCLSAMSPVWTADL